MPACRRLRLLRVRPGRRAAAGRHDGDHRPVRRAAAAQRNGATMPADFSRHARTLVEQYGLASGVFQLRVRADSPYVGTAASAHRPRGLSRPAARRGPGRRYRRAAAPARAWPRATICCCAATPRRPPSRAADMHLAFRDDECAGRRRGDPVQPPLRPRRGGDPAALRPDRPDRLSRHGDRQRRPHHPRRAARRRGAAQTETKAQEASCCRPATPCCCRAPGRRSTCASTIPTSWW